MGRVIFVLLEQELRQECIRKAMRSKASAAVRTRPRRLLFARLEPKIRQCIATAAVRRARAEFIGPVRPVSDLVWPATLGSAWPQKAPRIPAGCGLGRP